ncbi:transmembrane signal receptor [Lithospermum erythrorhizon]|uniref:Transmembrane signal receptor n=1 Tax=Lithospermum erythrorhizon TaxID=34254 RepID=A0AAV3QVJ2_LITER
MSGNRMFAVNYKGLQTLQSKGMVRGLPEFKPEEITCVDCLNGKQPRSAIPKESKWRASTVLELIHSDLCGPISPTSNSGKRYFLSFIDDFSRKAWVYLLVNKSDTFSYFKVFKAMVENESNMHIKCLRTDRGGEYNSRFFDEFCKDHGIRRQLTNAYTPQQNGVAERKNRTVMNMVRALMSAKGIPKSFWPEAVNWTFYVLNRCPTLAVKDKTPQEAWSGSKPSVEHFRIWGCLAHVHVPKVHRSKLDERSNVCIFLGVSDGTKGYRLFDVNTKRIVISNDVVFEEEKQWNWGEGYKEQISADLEWNDNMITEENETDVQTTQSESTDIDTTGESSISTTQESSESEQGGENSNPGRTHRAPGWMRDYVYGDGLSEEDEAHIVMDIEGEDPITYEEAVQHEKWRTAMDNEISSIQNNNTWKLTSLPRGAKRIGVKWIFKTKRDENGVITKHKARLVAKGYTQQEGIDYAEVFAPVARMDTVRMILSIAAQRNWKIYQLDVKSAFLHGELTEDVYVDQPRGYEEKGKEDHVYKLYKALYGLKQAPRAWYSKIDSHFSKEGFNKCSSEQTLFTKRSSNGRVVIVSLYVDDLIYTGNDENLMMRFKKSMVREFDMSDLGLMSYFLGIEVMQRETGIFICQKRYTEELLKRFGMINSNPVGNPIVPGTKIGKDIGGKQVDETYYKQMVGSLMYLTSTRPDIMFATSLISRFMSKPTELHFQVAKRILRYLKGTIQFGIYYKNHGKLDVYTDSDYAGDLEDRKSTSGYVTIMSSGAVTWCSKKQPIVTLSTTEAEFVAATVCTCQVLWMKKVLAELGYEENVCTQIKCDNSSTIKLSKNPVMHGRCKHIDIRFHFLRDLVKDGVIELIHCGTTEQIADIMTKALKTDSFQKLRTALGVINLSVIS